MHDIDRTFYEADGFELDEDDFAEQVYGDQQFSEEDYGEGESDSNLAQEDFGYEGDQESPFDEIEEMDLASELLSVANDEEMDQFLGKFLRRAGRSIGRAVRSPVGRVLGGMLKGAARKVLPVAGGAVGGVFGGPLGASFGSRLAPAAGRIFGLETEGMSDEDQSFEAARHYVRFAGTAAKHAALASPAASPQSVAKKAVVMSARRHAPGLLASPSYKPVGMPHGTITSGRWFRVRRNNRNFIILQGV